ncbi:hypothetical protein KC348_g61 [Hortaea werneckii]|nr:hypothetical protein KC348_g61 [Hortaea werneckii]
MAHNAAIDTSWTGKHVLPTMAFLIAFQLVRLREPARWRRNGGVQPLRSPLLSDFPAFQVVSPSRPVDDTVSVECLVRSVSRTPVPEASRFAVGAYLQSIAALHKHDKKNDGDKEQHVEHDDCPNSTLSGDPSPAPGLRRTGIVDVKAARKQRKGPDLQPSYHHENAGQRQACREMAEVRQDKSFRKDDPEERGLHAAQKTRQTVYARTKQKNKISERGCNVPGMKSRCVSRAGFLGQCASSCCARQGWALMCKAEVVGTGLGVAGMIALLSLGRPVAVVVESKALISPAPPDFFISSELVECESDVRSVVDARIDGMYAGLAGEPGSVPSITVLGTGFLLIPPSRNTGTAIAAVLASPMPAGLCAPTPAAYAALASPLSPEYVDEPPEPPVPELIE